MLQTAAKFLRDMWRQLLAMGLCLGLMLLGSMWLERSTRPPEDARCARIAALSHACNIETTEEESPNY